MNTDFCSCTTPQAAVKTVLQDKGLTGAIIFFHYAIAAPRRDVGTVDLIPQTASETAINGV